MKPLFIIFLLITAATAVLPCQSAPVTLTWTGGGRYYQVERSNWSKYVNGVYSGLTHRETRSLIYSASRTAAGAHFSGDFFVFEETLRDMTATARQIDTIVRAAFRIEPTGRMVFTEDNGYPRLRSFPVFPSEPVQIGQKWQAESERIIDPLNSGALTRLPILVEYEFRGSEIYRGIEVLRLKARYATRYDQYRRRSGDDPSLIKATGTHDLDILISAATGDPLLITDRLDETFFYADNGSVRYRGSTALFSETPVPVNQDIIVPGIKNLIAKAADTGANRPAPQSQPEDSFGLSSTPPAATRPLSPPTTVPVTTPAPSAPATAAVPPVTPAPQSATPILPTAPNDPFQVEQTERGIRLSIRDIRFLADSDEILSSEQWRLDAIAATLALVPNSQFLIEGHTAAVGKPAGELALSIKRAERVAAELTKRGIPSGRFIFTGHGGTQPVADNASAAGRAQNRRVEITILE